MFFFAAAICHAGIADLPDGIPGLNGLPLRAPCREAVDSVPATVLTEAGLGVVTASEEDGEAPTGAAVPFVVGTVVVVPGARLKEATLEDGVEAGFIRCPISVFKLFNSLFNSLSRVSVFSFWLSIARGIKSLRVRTSSLMRRDSSSRRRLACFKSPMTVSTSVRALSRRVVRSASEDFSVSVSFDSWSRRAKAFSKDSSIACLSCSI